MDKHPAVSYISCATSPKEETVHITTLARFEEGRVVSETREDAESSDESGTNPMTIQLFHHYLA